MPVKIRCNVLPCNETITYALDRDDFKSRVFFKVASKLGNINVQISAIEKLIINPNQVQYVLPVYYFVTIFIKQLQQLTFPE